MFLLTDAPNVQWGDIFFVGLVWSICDDVNSEKSPCLESNKFSVNTFFTASALYPRMQHLFTAQFSLFQNWLPGAGLLSGSTRWHILMNMWRPWIFQCGLFLLVFVETYRDDGQCAVCLEEGCKTGVSRIILDEFDKTLWQKKNKIPECSVSNLKPDTPCMMSNGSLVLRTEQPLHFEGKDGASGGWKTFRSTNMPCADLDLPPNLRSSSGAPDLNQINSTANPTPTPTPVPTVSPWMIKTIYAACGSVFAVIVIIGVIAIVIYRRRKNTPV